MKKCTLGLSLVFALLIGTNVLAAKDCIYSGEYCCDGSFEAATNVDYSVRDRWMGYYDNTTVNAEIVTDSNYVYSGKQSIRFSNLPTSTNRGIYYKTNTGEFTFKKGDVVEISGWFTTDAESGTVQLAVGSTAVDFQNITSVHNGQWCYIYGHYTVQDDEKVISARINTNLHTQEGYVYADDLSLKRVKRTVSNSKIKKIATRNEVYAVVDDENKLWMWGKGNHCELNGVNTAVNNPTLMMNDVKDVCLGDGHVVVLLTNGDVFTWGRNDYGQLGRDIDGDISIPNRIATKVKSIAAGDYHTVYVNDIGELYGCGQNYSSTYLYSDTFVSFTPINVEIIAGNNSKKAESVWASKAHTFVRMSDGNLYAIGYNGNSQLGNNSYLPMVRYEQIFENIVDVECSEDYTVCVNNNKQMFVSGMGKYGNFGEADAYTTFTMINESVDDCAAGVYSLYYNVSNRWFCAGGSEYGMIGGGKSSPKALDSRINTVVAGEGYMLVESNNEISTNVGNIKLYSETNNIYEMNKLTFDISGRLVYNINDESTDAVIVSACYVDGKLVWVEPISDLEHGHNIIKVPRIENGVYKIMLWRDMDSLVPVEEPKLLTLATVSLTSEEYEGIYKLTIAGELSKSDSVSQSMDNITFYAYDKSEPAPTINNIKAFEQFKSNNAGAFNKIVYMNENPENCIFRIRVSGDVIEKQLD